MAGPHRVPADRYALPPDYVARSSALGLDEHLPVGTAGYWTPERLANTARYQAHVYAWADRIARRHRATRILDAGCGVGTKLVTRLAGPGRELWGVDQPAAIALARELSPGASYWSADLESNASAEGGPVGTFDMIICSDVLEHLADPDALMSVVRSRMAAGSIAILSTPDRDRLRGRGCRSSPKPDHVREWSRDEFIRYARSRGFEVLKSRLMPQDDAPIAPLIWEDAMFRAEVRPRSPLACHAVLCRRSGD